MIGRALIVAGWSPAIEAAVGNPAAARISVETADPEVIRKVAERAAHVPDIGLLCPLPDPGLIELFSAARELLVIKPSPDVDWSRLASLERLQVREAGAALGDLAAAPALRVLDIDSGAITELKQFGDLNRLEEFSISECPLRSVAGIAQLRSLRRLALAEMALADIDEIRTLKELRELWLSHLKKLSKIGDLSPLPHLRRLGLSAIPHLSDVDQVATARSLEELEIDLRVVPSPESFARLGQLRSFRIESAVTLDTIAFVRSMPRLETFFLFNGAVKDGDMSPLVDAPELKLIGYRDKRHYRPKRAEIEAHISRRT